MELIEAVQQSLIDRIIEEVNPAFIILFGSFAEGNAHEKSDIDLAYFSKYKLSSYDRFLLSNELAILAGREVDLIDIKEIDTVFNMQIFEKGIPIYIQDENEFVRQRIRSYSMYATLNQQRSIVIDAIKESGSVFNYE